MMSEYVIRKIKNFDVEGVRKLFIDAGWGNYANKIDKVSRGAKKSLALYGAYAEDKLVGYVRVVGDGETIIYFQDLVVLKSHKRKGIGKGLIDFVIHEFNNVRQKVLITDNNPEAIGFYRSVGFKDAESMGIISFLRFDD